jgi:hypothetical protein
MSHKDKGPKFRCYKKVSAGDWQQPIRKGYKMACCDCGLVHHMQFRIYQGRVQFRAWRANLLTKQLRRREAGPARGRKR